jgi:hypothetical protein
MDSRQIVKAAFAHRQGGRVPVDFGGFSCSMINVLVEHKLRQHYGLPSQPPRVADISTMTAVLDDDLQAVLGCDFIQPVPYADNFGNTNTKGWKEWSYHGETVLVPKDAVIKSDGRGGFYVYPLGDSGVEPSGHMPEGGFYFDNLERSPEFDEDTMTAKDQTEENQVVGPDFLKFYAGEIARIKKTGRAVVVTPGYYGLGDVNNVPGPNLKKPIGIRNIADWYTAPLMYPEFVEEVFDIEAERAIESFKLINDAFGNDIDIVYLCGADFGAQQGPLMDPEVVRKFHMPRYKKMNDWIHANTNWKTLKHSCGGIFPVLPVLIEAGFDAINPVQCSAAGMDPQNLKNTYGKDIVFWGGGVDTQKILPFGTPEEVRAQVLQRLEIFSKDGGYVFNTIHNIQAGTPIENIAAMIAAVKEFNK